MAGKANPTGWIRVPNGGTPELPSVYTAIREALQESADSIRTLQSQVDSIKPSAPAASGGLVGGAIGSISGGGGSGGGGSVTSVGLDLSTEAAAVFGVTGSPVLTAGTITLGLDTQTANKVFAGPTTGVADEPTFRSLVAGDIPDISATYLTVATAASTYLPLAGGTLTGRLNLPASTATPNGANLNLGSGATPSSFSDGDVWVTAIGINARVAGSSLTLFPYEGGQFTGTVTTAAGTMSAAGFILASGTNLTTPAAGAVEFDGTNLYFTPSATRKTVAFTDSNITGTSANVTGIVALANGGTNKALTASNGGIVYTDADSMEVLAGTATAGQILRSGASAAPSWSTATYPATTTINQILYSSAANTISGLATANDSILVTSATGVPSLATTIPTAVTIGGKYIYRVDGTDVAVADGGTGQSSYADGELLIGKTAGGTLNKTTLTAGTGVTITNGSGTITINATGLGGTVTAVTATAPIVSSGGTTPDISLSPRGAYIASDSPAVNRPLGWYTIAVCGASSGGRAVARFGVRDTASSRHESLVFYAMFHFASGMGINILQNGYYGTKVITGVRIKYSTSTSPSPAGIYAGAMLQVYIGNATNTLTGFLLDDNIHSASGWTYKNFVADGTDPGDLGDWADIQANPGEVYPEADETLASDTGLSALYRGGGGFAVRQNQAAGLILNNSSTEASASAILRAVASSSRVDIVAYSSGRTATANFDGPNVGALRATGTGGMALVSDGGTFRTFVGGTASTAERLRINTSGVVIVGSGEGTATLAGNTLRAPSGTGTDIAGGALTLAGGASTGSAAGGAVIFQTAPAGSAGTGANALAERMRITSAGNVGIGTTAPRSNLEVGNTTANQTIRAGGIYRGSGTYTTTGQETSRHQVVFSSWRDVQPDTIGAKIVAINKTAHIAPDWDLVQYTDIAFFTLNSSAGSADSTAERMRILSNGKVGIGTSAPLSWIAGSTLGAGTSPAVEIITGTSAGTYSEGLTVRHSNLDATAVSRELYLGLKFSSEATTTESNKWVGLRGYTSATFANSPNLGLVSGGAERVTITSGGNIGIGTAGPSYKLDVINNANSATVIRVQNTDPGSAAESYYAASSSGGEAELVSLSSGFTVNGIYAPNSQVVSGSGSGGFSVGAVNAAGVLRFYTGGAAAGNERMQITAAGNVTVDTNVLFVDAVNNRVGVNRTPTVALDVTGSAAVSGALTLTTTNLGYTTSGLQLRSSVPGASSSTDYFFHRGADTTVMDRIVVHTPSTSAGMGFAHMTSGGVTRFFSDGNTGDFAIDTNTFFLAAVSNRVGLGTTVPQVRLHVDGTAATLSTTLYNNTDSILAVQNGGTGVRLVSSTSTPTAIGSVPALVMITSRGTVNAATTVAGGDYLGRVVWQGLNSTPARHDSSEIRAAVDATPGAGVPGRLEFWTADAGAPVERMRVTSGGVLILGSGEAGTTPTGNTFRAPAGLGTNIAGGTLTITAGNGTGTGGSGSIVLRTAPVGVSGTTANTMTDRVTITRAGSVVIGNAALANTATDGYLYIPTIATAGAPTNAPTAQTGRSAIVFNTGDNRLYIYNATGTPAWKSVLLA